MTLLEAKDLGYKRAVLTVSPYGLGTYERIGVRKYGTIRRYGWCPD